MQFCPAPALDDFIEDGGLDGHFKGEEQPDAPQGHGFRSQLEPDPGADATGLRLHRGTAFADAPGPGHHHGGRNP